MLQVPYQKLAFPTPVYTSQDFRGVTRPLPIGQRSLGSRWKIPTVPGSNQTKFYRTNQQELTYVFIRTKKSDSFARNSGDSGLSDTEEEAASIRTLADAQALAPDDATMLMYANGLRSQLAKCDISNPKQSEEITLDNFEPDSLEEALKAAKDDKADLAILVLATSNVPVYAKFKEIADRNVGIHSLCVTQKKFHRQGKFDNKVFDEFVSNIAMKINLKLGGVNHSVRSVEDVLFKNNTMVIGVSNGVSHMITTY